MRKKINIIVVVLVLTLLASPLFATVDEALVKLNAVITELYNSYQMKTIQDTFKYSELNAFDKDTCFTGYSLTMYANTTYGIVMTGDNNVSGLDIFIFDKNGQQIQFQSGLYNNIGDAAFGVFQPKYTGTYIIAYYLKSVKSGKTGFVSFGLTYK